MHMTNLRRVGGSVMFAIPPVLLNVLNVTEGSPVGISLDHGRLLIDPAPTKYTLEDLIAQCDLESPLPEDDALWLESAPVGEEII